MKYLIVTRHKALIEYLVKNKIVGEDFEVIEHATVEDVKGKNVIGVLPHGLSCLTNTFTELTLKLPLEKRGQELTLDEIEKYIEKITTYKIEVLNEIK